MGEFKSGWRRVGFGQVVRLNKDKSKDPEADGLERYVGLEHIEPGDLRVRSWGDVAEGTTFTNRFRPGQILFGKRRAYQRKVAVADFEGVCSGDIYVLEPKDTSVLHPGLLPFICETDAFFNHAVGTSAGSLSPRTNWKSLANYQFDLPPFEEQQKIVRLLESSRTVADAFQDTVEAALQVRQSLQKLYFLEAHEEANTTVGAVASVRNGTTPRRSRPEYWGGDVPWLPTGKVNDRKIEAADELITQRALQECSLDVIPQGSTLIAMIGQGKTRGMAARLMFDATINQNFAAVVPGTDVDPSFLFYQLEAKYELLRLWSQGTNQQALNCSLVSAFPFWKPSIRVQQEIVEVLAQADSAHESAGARAATARGALRLLAERALAGGAE